MGNRAVAIIVFAAVATRAVGGTPFITEDPGTPPRGWEINLGLAFEKNRSNRILTAPSLDLNYSLDAHVQVNANIGGIAVFGVQDGSSLADTQFKIKWRVVDDADDPTDGVDAAGPAAPGDETFAHAPARGPVAVSIAPALILPTGDADRGLGAGAYQLRLPVQIGKTLGDWSLYGEVGYQFGVARTDAGRRVGGPITSSGDTLFFGAAVQYAVSDTVSLGAEINGARVLDARGDYTLLANLGGSVDLGDGWALLGTIGRTLREDSRGGPQVLVQVFLQVTF